MGLVATSQVVQVSSVVVSLRVARDTATAKLQSSFQFHGSWRFANCCLFLFMVHVTLFLSIFRGGGYDSPNLNRALGHKLLHLDVPPMDRRTLLKRLAAVPLLHTLWHYLSDAEQTPLPAKSAFRRVRTGDPAWPSAANWEKLKQQAGGNLMPVQFPLAACQGASENSSCQDVFKNLDNPFYIGDQPGLTQTLGWRTRGPPSPVSMPWRQEMQRASPQQ
jgi:hypothetical protein